MTVTFFPTGFEDAQPLIDDGSWNCLWICPEYYSLPIIAGSILLIRVRRSPSLHPSSP